MRTVLWKREARFELDSASIFHGLEETGEELGVEVDRESQTGTAESPVFRFFGMSYEWELSPGKGEYEVTEYMYVSSRWHLALISALVFIGVNMAVEGLSLSSSPVSILLIGWGFLTVPVMVAWIVGIAEFESVLKEWKNEDVVTFQPPLYILTVLSGATAVIGGMVGLFYHQPSALAGLSSALFLVVSAYVLVLYFDGMDSQTSWQINWTNIASTLSGFNYELVMIMALGAIPPVFLLFTPRIIRLSMVESPVLGGFVVVVRLVLLGLFILMFFYSLRLAKTMRSEARSDFLSGRRRTESSTVKLVNLLLATVISYGMLYAVVLVLRQYLASGLVSSPVSAVTAIAAVLPASYFLAGLSYQVSTYLRQMTGLFRDSEKTSITLPDHPDIEVRKLAADSGVDQYYASSLSTGLKDYIFISESIFSEFEPEERDAVLGHEAAHISNGDALLNFYIPLASLPFLIGRNLIYSIIDYRDREFQADRDAVNSENGNRDGLRNALKRIKGASRERKERRYGVAPALVPFDGNLRVRGLAGPYFDLFFGTFALQEAHPIIDERIDNINSDET